MLYLHFFSLWLFMGMNCIIFLRQSIKINTYTISNHYFEYLRRQGFLSRRVFPGKRRQACFSMTLRKWKVINKRKNQAVSDKNFRLQDGTYLVVKVDCFIFQHVFFLIYSFCINVSFTLFVALRTGFAGINNIM